MAGQTEREENREERKRHNDGQPLLGTALGKHTGKAAPPNLSPTPATSLSGFCLCLWRCWRFCKDKPIKQGLRILDLTGRQQRQRSSALCKAGLEMDHLGYFQVGRCAALVSRMLRRRLSAADDSEAISCHAKLRFLVLTTDDATGGRAERAR